MIQIQVSAGELLDKITILEIKNGKMLHGRITSLMKLKKFQVRIHVVKKDIKIKKQYLLKMIVKKRLLVSLLLEILLAALETSKRKKLLMLSNRRQPLSLVRVSQLFQALLSLRTLVI